MIDIKQAISDGRKVKFIYFRAGSLYYETEFGDVFPVPHEDTDGATFSAEHKASELMRYMRKYNSSLEIQAPKSTLV